MSIPFYGEKFINGLEVTIRAEVFSTENGFEAEIFGKDEKPIRSVYAPNSEGLMQFLQRIENTFGTSSPLRRERDN